MTDSLPHFCEAHFCEAHFCEAHFCEATMHIYEINIFEYIPKLYEEISLGTFVGIGTNELMALREIMSLDFENTLQYPYWVDNKPSIEQWMNDNQLGWEVHKIK